MVKEHDFVDLDPEPANLLAVWGYKVSEKNLEKYILAIGGAASKLRGSGEVWGIGNIIGFLEESLLITFNCAWKADGGTDGH